MGPARCWQARSRRGWLTISAMRHRIVFRGEHSWDITYCGLGWRRVEIVAIWNGLNRLRGRRRRAGRCAPGVRCGPTAWRRRCPWTSWLKASGAAWTPASASCWHSIEVWCRRGSCRCTARTRATPSTGVAAAAAGPRTPLTRASGAVGPHTGSGRCSRQHDSAGPATGMGRSRGRVVSGTGVVVRPGRGAVAPRRSPGRRPAGTTPGW